MEKPNVSAADYIRKLLANERPPRSPLFDAADRDATTAEKDRYEHLKRYIETHDRPKPDPKVGPFQPFLLIRSVSGDHGVRPFAFPKKHPFDPFQFFLNAPDIWLAQGDPLSSPTPKPPQPGVDRIRVGETYTLYAHVWNLGMAPIGAAKVEFFAWYAVDDVTCALDTNMSTHRIGVARVDLPPRTSPSCHRLVKCPLPMVVDPKDPDPAKNMVNKHVAIVAQISGLGDPVTDMWDPIKDRHVGRRDVSYFPWIR